MAAYDKIRTALVRDWNGNLGVKRLDGYANNRDFASDLRGNGYRVLKVWAHDASESEVDEWLYISRG